MALTNGSLYGQIAGNPFTNAFSPSNTGNPNNKPSKDVFQILGLGNICLLQVTAAGVVNTNVAASSVTADTVLARVQLTAAQYRALPASPSAAQICQAAFPLNYAAQQLDVFQIISAIPSSPAIKGGGAVTFRLTYNGVGATS